MIIKPRWNEYKTQMAPEGAIWEKEVISTILEWYNLYINVSLLIHPKVVTNT